MYIAKEKATMQENNEALKQKIAIRRLIGIHNPEEVQLVHKLNSKVYEVHHDGEIKGTIPCQALK